MTTSLTLLVNGSIGRFTNQTSAFKVNFMLNCTFDQVIDNAATPMTLYYNLGDPNYVSQSFAKFTNV